MSAAASRLAALAGCALLSLAVAAGEAEAQAQPPAAAAAVSTTAALAEAPVGMQQAAPSASHGNAGGLELRLGGRDLLGDDEAGMSAALKLVLGLTALSLLPAALLAITSFTRIVIVLSFVRRAIGTQTLPPNQTLIGLALFLTLFTMWPVLHKVHTEAVEPVRAGSLGMREGFDRAAAAFRDFMVPRTRERDLALFVEIAGAPRPAGPEDVSLLVAVPAYVVSELRTAFEMGLVIFVPFVVIDLVVSAILLALGMMMLPPALVSAPVKILLFVLVDGWHLVVRSLVESVVP